MLGIDAKFQAVQTPYFYLILQAMKQYWMFVLAMVFVVLMAVNANNIGQEMIVAFIQEQIAKAN